MEPLNIAENADQMENNIGKAEYYIQQLNVKNAKKIALCLVIGFICYHGLIHLRYGNLSHFSLITSYFHSLRNVVFDISGTDSCKWLLSDGRFKGNREWQPYGCMLHNYSHM